MAVAKLIGKQKQMVNVSLFVVISFTFRPKHVVSFLEK
jgi:hypothetical protein